MENNIKKDELRECPFCGGEADIVTIKRPNAKNMYSVACGQIACMGFMDKEFVSSIYAKESWNTRTQPIQDSVSKRTHLYNSFQRVAQETGHILSEDLCKKLVEEALSQQVLDLESIQQEYYKCGFDEAKRQFETADYALHTPYHKKSSNWFENRVKEAKESQDARPDWQKQTATIGVGKDD